MTGGLNRQGLFLAVSAGIMAALGSVSAKLATSGHILVHFCQISIQAEFCVQVKVLFILIVWIKVFLTLLPNTIPEHI